MKHLKLLFIPLVIFSLFALVKATNCPFDEFGGYCDAGQYCASTQCECNGTMINSGSICGDACTFDGLGYTCDIGDYCAGPSTNQCDCDGTMITGGMACNPTPTPPVSCTWAGRTIFVGQSMQVYQFSSVPYASGSCGGITLSCSNSGGVGLLTPIYPAYSGYNFSGCIVLPPPPPPTGSCTLGGVTILSGASITTYQTSSVSCGSSCTSQTRTCTNGILSGTFLYGSCSVNGCGGGGGGGYPTCTNSNLVCVNNIRVRTGSTSCQGGNLGHVCTVTSGSNGSSTGSIVGSPFTSELNNAYLRAYAQGITTMNTIQKANMTGHLLRSHMAKMISNFAITLGGLTPNTARQCNFTDISSQTAEMKFYIKLACQLGLMGIKTNGTPDTLFNPKGEVTRAQFGTILSRVLRGDRYEGGVKYYTNHLAALKREGIMTNISNPSMKEVRGYVMIMMKRVYDGGYLND